MAGAWDFDGAWAFDGVGDGVSVVGSEELFFPGFPCSVLSPPAVLATDASPDVAGRGSALGVVLDDEVFAQRAVPDVPDDAVTELVRGWVPDVTGAAVASGEGADVGAVVAAPAGDPDNGAGAVAGGAGVT